MFALFQVRPALFVSGGWRTVLEVSVVLLQYISSYQCSTFIAVSNMPLSDIHQYA